jgi:hypothetical protein
MKALWFAFWALVIHSQQAFAHERWVKHDLLAEIDTSLFHPTHAVFQSLALRCLAFSFAILGVWLMRQQLAQLLERQVPKFRKVANFVLQGDGIQDLNAIKLIESAALRLPALVLIYSAAGGYLIMPTFPVPAAYLDMARLVQAVMAIMIVAEFQLPVVGAAIFATIAFIFAHYGAPALDVLPVAGVAYLYLTTTTRRPDAVLTARQIDVTRAIIGASFFMLGIMKIVFPKIIVGVVDHYSSVMADPLIMPFWIGTSSATARECWALGFALSEMMTGGLIAFGIFSRPLALVSAFVFSKLMLSSFGWLEFPHIFPISCLLLVALHPSRRQQESLKLVANPMTGRAVEPAHAGGGMAGAKRSG